MPYQPAGSDVSAEVTVIDGYHDVPSADAVTNAQMRDVIGNKEDAAAIGNPSSVESLMAYAKQNVNLNDVVVADSSSNDLTKQVIGNKADAAAAGPVTSTDTIVAYLKQLVTAQVAEVTGVGVRQVATTTIDLEQAAAAYDLFTGTDQVFMLTGLSFKMPNVDASDDATITSIAIATDDVTPGVIISSTDGAVANLTAEAELSWTGLVRITVGTKIQLTIAGGASDAATVCLVVAEGYAVVAGGNLA